MSETLKKHSLKIQIGTIVTVALFLVSFTWWVTNERAAIYKELGTAENQYEHCHKWMEGIDERVDDLEDQEIQQDLVLVEVKTRLSNIEALLEEIKLKLK